MTKKLTFSELEAMPIAFMLLELEKAAKENNDSNATSVTCEILNKVYKLEADLREANKINEQLLLRR